MKKYIVALMLFVPSFTFAAPLTTTQAESLINVVQSSPNTPASAFTSLITSFSDITDAQADSLVAVVQAAPGVNPVSFVNMLVAFTIDPVVTQSVTPTPSLGSTQSNPQPVVDNTLPTPTPVVQSTPMEPLKTQLFSIDEMGKGNYALRFTANRAVASATVSMGTLGTPTFEDKQDSVARFPGDNTPSQAHYYEYPITGVVQGNQVTATLTAADGATTSKTITIE